MYNINIEELSGKKVKYVTFPIFKNEEDLVAVFTTRIGGVSRGRYASMNCSFTNGDDKESVYENFKLLTDELGIDINKLTFSQQTHTVNVMVVKPEDVGKGLYKERDYENIDGLITNIKGVGLVTQFADCVPLLFYDKNKKVIAAAHGGWKGTVGEIAKITAEKMVAEFGSDKKDILVAIAPSICKDCYEVDDVVINEVKKIKGIEKQKVYTEKPNGKYMLNLWELNREILINCGIPSENIGVSNICTNCNSHIFHSHRATAGIRGNNAAIICMK